MTAPETQVIQKQHDYLIQLDGLRFVAVTLVMVDHWLGEAVRLPLGYFGVNLFFVLSGFLITRILLTSKAKDQRLGRSHGFSLRQFYIRRSLRIFPIYYVTILALVAIDFPAVRAHLGWLLTYTPNLWVALHQTWLGAIDHLWSLAVEEQYYLFFPFLIFWTPNRYVLSLLFGLTGLSVLLRLILFLSGTHWTVSFVLMPTCLDAFGLGGLMAWLLVFRPEWFRQFFRKQALWLAGFVLYAVNLALMMHFAPERTLFSDVLDRLCASLFCFMIIGRAVIGYEGAARWLLENAVSNYLGRISYGLYLFHNLVFNYYHSTPSYLTLRIWRRLMGYLPGFLETRPVQLAYFYALTVLIATVSWYAIERPVNRLKDRFSY